MTALALVQHYGFSEKMIESFLRPWLGGIFLETELSTSSRMLEFVFRFFADGDAAIPAAGMQAIPRQLAAGLPEDSVRCGVAVVAVEGRTIHLSSGERLTGRHIVVATDGAAASRLLPEVVVAPSWRQAVTLYFAAAVSPVGEPTLLLNGTGGGCIGHIVDLSRVAPRYAPTGQSLVSLSVRGAVPESDDELVALIRAEAGGWFGGDAVAAWRLLRVDRIRQALPVRWPLVRSHPVPVRDGVWVCGDHRDTASIQGAMQSGRETAEAVIAFS
jgi:predicted NAD/FAD-dependent oxidoreductase